MANKWRSVVKVISFAFLLMILAVTPVVLYGYNYACGVLREFSTKRDFSSAFDLNTFLYEDNGNLLYEIHGEVNRTPILLDKVPYNVQMAFVAIEDERFYKHIGVDLKAIIRAAVSYYKSGEISEGASTITQQVIKLYFLSPEQTMQRKMREAVLALEFERRFSKDEILELYLNRVYFGEGAYGIQSASKVYFNKDAENLTLEEGALLAALIQAPSAYDPYFDPESAQRRRNVVLDKMNEQGYISFVQKLDAQEKPVELETAPSMENYNSFFVDYVMDEAMSVVNSDEIFKGGLKIYTTMEPAIQKKVEEVCARNDLYPSELMEVAVAMVENGTGKVKALIGGRKYLVNRGFNRATQLTRQPGSAFKPIAVYVPAFELGYSPDSIISDTPFKLGNYEPKNSGGGYYGPVSIRTAVQWSRNVAAVRLLNQIGIDEGFKMAQKLGFNLVEDDRCLPLALGGLTNGVTPLQMAGAYASFASGGIYTKPYAIKRIEDSQGKVLYEHPQGVMVMQSSTASSVTEVLRGVVNGGTGSRARLRDAQVAGKTGTTELPNTPEYRGLDGNKDAWFVGFTEKYTAAVWLGYDERNMDRYHYLTSYGGNQPAEIFRLAMANVLGLDGGQATYYAAQPLTLAQQSEQKTSDEEKLKEQEEQGESLKSNALANPGIPGDNKSEQPTTGKQTTGQEGRDNLTDKEDVSQPATPKPSEKPPVLEPISKPQ